MMVGYEGAHQGNVDSMQDLQREMAFYNQAKHAMEKGLALLEEANVPVDRPPDYFAEMVKSDEHMEYIRLRLAKQKRRLERIEEKKKEAAQQKFGKAKQREKKQEQLKRKKAEANAVKTWQEKRKQGLATEKDLEDIVSGKGGTGGGAAAAANALQPKKKKAKTKKQEYKDRKFGAHGRKPASAKRNDAQSARDMSDFDPKRNRAPFAGGGGAKKSKGGGSSGNRPGKARRQKERQHKQQHRK